MGFLTLKLLYLLPFAFGIATMMHSPLSFSKFRGAPWAEISSQSFRREAVVREAGNILRAVIAMMV